LTIPLDIEEEDMEGVVLGYESEEGVIKAADGSRYRFSRADWKSSTGPVAGLRVDFVAEDGQAKEIYPLNPLTSAIFGTMSDADKAEKTMPMVVYLCYLSAFLYGFSMIIGVIIAYTYRRSAEGKWYRSHYDYQISIFWKSLIGFAIGILTFFFGVGVVVMACTYIWVVVKIVKGWRALSEGAEIGK
jgi:uncharacterized membrane protein